MSHCNSISRCIKNSVTDQCFKKWYLPIESQVLIRKYGLYVYLQIRKIRILINSLYKKKMVVCMLGESPCMP